MKKLISAEDIQVRIAELAREIERDYHGEPVTLLGVLTGCLIFVADLVRELRLRTRIGFIQASSYRGATTPGRLEILPTMLPDVRGRHVLLVDDILDTGQTLTQVVEHVRRLEPLSLRVTVLLRKRGRQIVPFEPNYVGFEIPDAFVVGYGLDYNDDYRQLPHVAVYDESDASAASR
jgi:hypoxanthine phosphoribosyltransferase